MRFTPTEFTAAERALQDEVRSFLAAELPPGSHEPGLGMSARHDRAFSAKMAERGWVGMALPKEWGGSAKSAVDRFIVVEEMLRWGAPVGHHWVADRQTGNVILKFGTDEQRERFLPAICRGELGFSIGMSEPDSGSDLASVSTRAERTDGGWILNGTKIWTSNAHMNDWFICLVRTHPIDDGGTKHQGLSQMLVDLKDPALEIGPIPFLNGEHHFNEVAFHDHFVPDDRVTKVESHADWLAVYRERLRSNGSFPLGVARRCCLLLDRSDFDRGLAEAREALDTASNDEMPQARADAALFAVRASTALVAATGGRAVTLDDHAQRLHREAMFLLVQGQTPQIRAHMLDRLA